MLGGLRPQAYVHNPMEWVDPLGLAGHSHDSPNVKKIAKFKRWKKGDAIDKPLPDGSVPSWDIVRGRYWKNRAALAKKGEFSQANIRRMKRGSAPIDFNPRTGKMESRELHHIWPQRADGSNDPLNLRELTPDQHGAVDAFRHTVPTTRGIL